MAERMLMRSHSVFLGLSVQKNIFLLILIMSYDALLGQRTKLETSI